MKKIYIATFLVVATQACRLNDEPATVSPSSVRPTTEIDALIWQKLQTTGAFRWNMASEELVWSALRQSDGVLSVGYKSAGVSSDLRETIHTINIHEGAWQQAREQVLNLILTEERKVTPSLTLADLEAYPEEVLPVLDVRVKSLSTIQKLRSSGLVRYAEPIGYEPGTSSRAKVASSSGCGSNIADIPLYENEDYITIAPGTKSSWHHPFHGVRDAWAKSSGAGVKLMIIDTGSSPDQNNLTTNFNQGSSTGRTIERLVTLPKAYFWSSSETPNDGCGHGTAMAGAAAGPRGTDGAAAGVAYNANLVTVRAAADVVLDESREVKGASDAYILAGNRSDIKIVSMSMGRMTSSSQLADAIRYAYNKGKLMFCAGGTSFSWTTWYGVTFPATMPEVQAVTGVKDRTYDEACNSCHKGSEIDFVVVMEKAANERHVPTLAMSGDAPSTVGGSSVATATTAGMAALLWSRNPGLTRDQVVGQLAAAASNYPNRNGSFGWGRIDINKAMPVQ
ncbi:hypothetical protein GCM10023189_54940 [Nibrella saemangeumensis]|uniref:Peptidase S8/S53 domain-containing protein n=1 Tax=Nibrella saemangeumensis TaxID=1084526 RepID=A0ABP8NPS7_9BACT